MGGAVGEAAEPHLNVRDGRINRVWFIGAVYKPSMMLIWLILLSLSVSLKVKLVIVPNPCLVLDTAGMISLRNEYRVGSTNLR